MIRKISFFCVFVLLGFVAQISMAQQTYNTGLGLRGGYPSGITLKQFLSKNTAAEGVLSFGWGGFGVTGLYQIHNIIPEAPGFTWYYGGGGHIATAKTDRNSPFSGGIGGELYLGLDGILGVEYVFADAPLSISVDILPILNIINEVGVWFNTGLSLRYTFK
jgi:hypothetical protein